MQAGVHFGAAILGSANAQEHAAHGEWIIRMTSVSVSADTTSISLPSPGVPDLHRDALFLDVDGSILDLNADPAQVRAGPELLATLAALHARFGGALALLSGRSLRQMDAILPGLQVAMAGLHGAQLRMVDGAMWIDAPALPGAVAAHALDRLGSFPGVIVEDKGVSLALHFRMAPEQAGRVDDCAGELLAIAGSGYELLAGKCVVEIKPRGHGKGRALDLMHRHPPFASRRPWMVGDDLTDEHAFARVNAAGGVAVIVGERRPTLAGYGLTDPAATRAWLHGCLS